ncbi:uncharacterized protein TNCV_2798141 [Trichonephila clavipes]|nr:uncharacterized protein TNCV_2798141 [Trichonephila clavipes]
MNWELKLLNDIGDSDGISVEYVAAGRFLLLTLKSKWLLQEYSGVPSPLKVGKNRFQRFHYIQGAAEAELYRYWIVACLVTSSSPVTLKIRRVGQRCTFNLSRAEASSRWCNAVVRRGGASSGVIHVN